MDRKKSRFDNLFLTGITTLLLLSGCASAPVNTSTPKTSTLKQTPQQLIMQDRKDEAMQEFQMPTDINAMDEDGNTVPSDNTLMF